MNHAPSATGPRACPKCGLLNDPTGESCDCGYDFVSRSMRVPIPKAIRKPAATGFDAGHIARIAKVYRSLVVSIGLIMALAFAPKSVVIVLAVFALVVFSSVTGYRLAAALGFAHPLLWALGFFIPGVHLVTLFALSSHSRRICTEHGLPVGLLGPSQNAIADFVRNSARD